MNKNENKNYLHIFFKKPDSKTCKIALVTHILSKNTYTKSKINIF